MNRENMTKVFSTTLSLALALTSVPVHAASPLAEPAFAGLTPPARFGYVASSFAPNGERAPRLIVISDLHGHLEVQKNIMAMLDHFVNTLTAEKSSTAQAHVPIFVEGGWEDHLEQPLKAVKDPSIRATLASYLLDKAELAAAQTYSELHLNAGKVTLTGVENKEEYEMNKQRFAETYPERKKLLEAIAIQERTLNTLRDSVNGRSYQKLYAMRQNYDKGILSQERYAKALVNFARRCRIEGKDVDVLKNVNASASSDVELALVKVYQVVSEVFAKDRPLTSYLRPSLPKEDRIRMNVGYFDSRLDLLKRLLGNQLTPEEVPLALSKMAELVQVAQILLKDQKLGFDISQAVQKSLDFYPFAFMRDESLTENSLAALDRDAQHVPTGILVAGGFHADGITKQLRERNIPYLLINPVITRDITADEQLNYIRRICDDHVTPLEVSFDFSHGAAGRLASDASGIPVTNLGNEARGTLPNANSLAEGIVKKTDVKDYGFLSFNPGQWGGTERATHVATDAGFISGEKVLTQAGFAKNADAQLKVLAEAKDLQFEAVSGKTVLLHYIEESHEYVSLENSETSQGIARSFNQRLALNPSQSPKSPSLFVQAVKGTIDTTYKSNPNQKNFQVYSRQAAHFEADRRSVVLLSEDIFDQVAAGKTSGKLSPKQINREQIATHELGHENEPNEHKATLMGFALQAVLTQAVENGGVDPTKSVHKASMATVKRVLFAATLDGSEQGDLAMQLLKELDEEPASEFYTATELADRFAQLVPEPELTDADVQKYSQDTGLTEQTIRLAFQEQQSFGARMVHAYSAGGPTGWFAKKLKRISESVSAASIKA